MLQIKKTSRLNLRYITNEVRKVLPQHEQKYYFGISKVIDNDARWSIVHTEKVEFDIILTHLNIDGLQSITIKLLKEIVGKLIQTKDAKKCINLLKQRKKSQKTKKKRKLSELDFVEYGQEYANKHNQISTAHFFEVMEKNKKIKYSTSQRNTFRNKLITNGFAKPTGMQGLNLKMTKSSSPSINSNSNSNSISLNDDDDVDDDINKYVDDEDDDDLILNMVHVQQKQCPHCTFFNPTTYLVCDCCKLQI